MVLPARGGQGEMVKKGGEKVVCCVRCVRCVFSMLRNLGPRAQRDEGPAVVLVLVFGVDVVSCVYVNGSALVGCGLCGGGGRKMELRKVT